MIAPGPSDVDRDGPAFIGDPDMGFSGLRTFGPTLLHHTQLKIRSNTAVENFMLVDSPGMSIFGDALFFIVSILVRND